MTPSSIESAYTMSIRLIGIVTHGLESAGVDPGQVLARVGLDTLDLDDVDQRISHVDGMRLMEASVEATGDESFGLSASQVYVPGAHTMEFLASSSGTVGQMMERVCRYYRLMIDAAEPRLDVEGELAIWRFRMRAGIPMSRTLAELITGIGMIAVRMWTESQRNPDEIHFCHRRPADASAYERLFGSSLFFGSEETSISFPKWGLDRQIVGANPDLARVLEPHAEALLARHPTGDGFMPHVREVLADQLKNGRPQANDLARRLGMSPRSLRRHLQSHETSHQALLSELRRDIAEAHLAERNLAIEEVAMMLGYSEPSTFHRAFKGWTGETPLDYRRRARAEQPH